MAQVGDEPWALCRAQCNLPVVPPSLDLCAPFRRHFSALYAGIIFLYDGIETSLQLE